MHNFRRFFAGRGITKLHAIQAIDFDAWRAARLAISKPGTVQDESILIEQLFKFARSRKLIAENPLADIKLPEPRSISKPAPSLEQVNDIISAADEELRVWLLMLALTGQRVGELQRLRTEDVDLVGGWIHIASRPGAETKNKESRKVPMHARLRRTLEALPPRTHRWFFTATPGSRYPEGGHRINTSSVNKRLAVVLGRIGLPAGREAGFVVHSLRHFFETVTVHAGIPQFVINRWMGHSDRTMGSTCFHLSDCDSQACMARVPFGDGSGEGIPTPVATSASAGCATEHDSPSSPRLGALSTWSGIHSRVGLDPPGRR